MIVIPGSASVEIDKSISYTASVTPSNGTVSRVDFSSINAGIATVNPATDATVPYKTTASGESIGSTQVQAEVVMSGAVRCTDTANITVTPPNAWWQVDKGNVHADGGSINSSIPATATKPYLITGIQPGLVSYSGSLSLGDLDVTGISETSNDWQAKTSYQGNKTDYGYFKRILEDDLQAFAVWDGSQPGETGVYSAAGDISTSGVWNITTKKIVILADGNVTITGNINVDPDGFLAVISSGNITIGPAVTNVEGVYISDGVIDSGASASQLTGEGIFTGWLGIDLRRDFNTIQNNTTPAERFIYRPDLVRNAYHYLLKPKVSWQEVAP